MVPPGLKPPAAAIALEVARGASAAVATIMADAKIIVFVSIKDNIKMFYKRILRHF